MKSRNHRIVFVSGGIKLGGASTFLLNLGGELIRRGFEVLIVSLEHENPYASDFALMHIPLHVEDERYAIFEDRLSSALQVIRHFRATVVISCLGPSSYEILRYVPKSVRRIGMIQADSPDMYPVFAAYASFFDATVGVSRQIAANLSAHPIIGRLPVHYLPYGVPPAPKTGGNVRRRGQPIRILYLGRLVRPQKRVHLFPQILQHLKAANIRFQWTIAGDGPERSSLEKQMISCQSASEVAFAGAINYRDVPRLLDSHDIFLLISDHEGLPLSLLEAMAHGLVPVVSNLSSGVSEIVDQQCGILVDPTKIDAYAAGIIWLSENPCAFSDLSKNARERIGLKYSVTAMTDRWLAVFRPVEEPVSWPADISINGPILDRRKWRYTWFVRFFRRLLKHLRIAAIFDVHLFRTKRASNKV